MASIFSYIDQYGDKLFNEEAFNEVDAAILSCVAYMNFDGIVSSKNDKITLLEAANSLFALYTDDDLDKNIIGIKDSIKVFKYIKNKNRYKDLLLYNYVYEKDYEKQFSAICIDLDYKMTLICFEGTDELISGWKEDAIMAYKFPVDSHKAAIKYVNSKMSYLAIKDYIVVGHSKGGNLALVASMYANPLLKRKIKKVYSFDGQGLKGKQINSRAYKKINDRFEHIVPNYSFVGMLFKSYKFKVIKASRKDLFAHDILYWEVDDNRFKLAPLSDFSIGIDKIFTKWVGQYNDKEREKIVNDTFKIFDEAGINSLLDIKEAKITSVFKLLKKAKNIDEDTKKNLMELLSYMFTYFKNYKIEQFKSIFKK